MVGQVAAGGEDAFGAVFVFPFGCIVALLRDEVQGSGVRTDEERLFFLDEVQDAGGVLSIQIEETHPGAVVDEVLQLLYSPFAFGVFDVDVMVAQMVAGIYPGEEFDGGVHRTGFG